MADLDAKIADLETKIAEVEDEIRGVSVRFEDAVNSKNDHLIDVFAKEKEQLRNKEEQLRNKEEQLRKEKEQLREAKLQAGASERPSGISVLIRGSKGTKGTRLFVFEKLQDCFACLCGSDRFPASYNGDDLKVTAGFRSAEHLMRFENILSDANVDPLHYSMHGRVTWKHFVPQSIGNRIFKAHYFDTDEDSPQVSVTSGSSLGTNTPPSLHLQTHQSIENPEAFVCGLEHAHLMAKTDCPDEYNKIDDNFLALTKNMHALLDGLGRLGRVPGIALGVVERGEHPYVDNGVMLTSVKLEIICRTEEIARFVGPCLADGAEQVGRLKYHVIVRVHDADIFEECVTWKRNKTFSTWQCKGLDYEE